MFLVQLNFFILILWSWCGVQGLSRIRADPERHWFLDPEGRVRLFHGVNSVEKEFPWYRASYMLNDTKLDHLQEWGMNVVRLGTMWSGVEPYEDQFNSTYMDIIDEIVERLASRGIYTIMDMHQDVMSSNYGQYDGVPKWLVDKYPPPENPYPWPLEEITAWEQGYLTQATSEGFQYFYDNANDSMVEWGQFWSAVSSNFTGNPNVFGYNLINEPWIGDYFTDNNLTLPGYAAQVNLVPSYDMMHEEIRQYDTEAMILYEPVFYGQLREYPIRGSGFTKVPGGDEFRNISAYSFHTYCWPLEFKPENYTEEDLQERADYCESDFLPEMFSSAYSTVNRTGGGVILTEFGICKTWEDRVDLECDVFMRLADEYLMSWIDWDYNDRGFYDSNGDYIPGKVYFYTRPYAQATAGIPTAMQFNSTTLDFHYEYIIDAKIKAPTEVFVPSFHYSCGYNLQFSDNIYTEIAGPDRVNLYATSIDVDGELAEFHLSLGSSCV